MTHALCHGPMLLTLGKYFNKRRGLATTLASVGSSLAGLSMPVLTRYLVNDYGLHGSLMIVSGILLNFVVIGALLRPIDLSKKAPDSDKHETEERILNGVNNGIHSSSEERIPEDQAFKFEKTVKGMTLYVPEKAESTPKLNVMYDRLVPEPIERLRTYSSSSAMKNRKPNLAKHLHTNSSTSFHQLDVHKLHLELTASTGDITGGSAFNLHNVEEPIADHRNTKNEVMSSSRTKPDRGISDLLTLLLSQVFDKNVLQNRLFLMFMAVVFTAIIGAAQILTFIPAHSNSIGLTDDEVSYLYIISGCCDMFSKIIIASIADCHFIRRHHILAFCIITAGVVVNFIPFFKTFKTMVILIAANGLFGQIYFGLFPVILADFVGIENLSSAIGVVIMLHGIALSISNPILGKYLHFYQY